MAIKSVPQEVIGIGQVEGTSESHEASDVESVPQEVPFSSPHQEAAVEFDVVELQPEPKGLEAQRPAQGLSTGPDADVAK